MAFEPVELKLWFAPPAGAAVPLINMGADGTMLLPAGLDQELGPAPMFTVTPAHPRGFSQLGCRLLDPFTGAVRHADVNRFAMQVTRLAIVRSWSQLSSLRNESSAGS